MVYLTDMPMEDFAYWLASFLDAHVPDTSVPCRMDVLLKTSCWLLPPQHHRCLLLRAQRVAKWCCERRRKTRPQLPLFEVTGKFPQLCICCSHVTGDPHQLSIEQIAARLAMDLDYVDRRQLECCVVSTAPPKKRKRVQNKSLTTHPLLHDTF